MRTAQGPPWAQYAFFITCLITMIAGTIYLLIKDHDRFRDRAFGAVSLTALVCLLIFVTRQVVSHL